MWIGSRHLILKPKQANLLFEYGEDHLNKTQIFLIGLAEHESIPAGKEFFLKATEVSEDYNPPTISVPNLVNESKKESVFYHGYAILHISDNEFKKESFEIELNLKPKEFERLIYFIDKSIFASNAKMTISLSVIGLEIGHEPFFDKFPLGKQLPIVGHSFSIRNWE